MLIGIDGNEANFKERVGVHQYAFELLWAIYRIQNQWKGKHRFIIYLKSVPSSLLPRENSLWTYKIIPGKGFWVLKSLMPALLLGQKPDVFFSPSHYLPPITLMPKICTIHDLGYLEFSEQFKKYDFWQLKYWTAISISISKYIIAVSESTKKDIVRHYPFASKKIKVVYHGLDKKRFNNKISLSDVRHVQNKYQLPENYILFLGTLRPSKNIEGLVSAFALVVKKFPEFKLVIAGKKGWLYQSIFQKVKNLKLEDRVIFTDFISEEDKPALYKGAKILVSPSFWEGFGLHVLEALACGTPVVVSKIASLPEVVGEARIYIDPYSSVDIANGIETVLKMRQKEYNKLVDKGYRQIVKFSWESTAIDTVKILEEAVK